MIKITVYQATKQFGSQECECEHPAEERGWSSHSLKRDRTLYDSDDFSNDSSYLRG